MSRLRKLSDGEPVAWAEIDATPAEFIEALDEHDLTGLVQHWLSCRQPENDWPDELLADLTQRTRAAAVSELVRQEEIISVLDALAADGIHPILLKGTPLAYTLYPSPPLRPRCDTDLLVPRAQVERVRAVMTALGYAATRYCNGELLFCQFEFQKRDRFGIRHAFDIHWKVSTQAAFADLLTYDELLAEAEAVPALGTHARSACSIHALLLACVHPVMHHRNVERLIWIHDVHLLASRLPPAGLERFAALAIARKVGAICAHELSMARARFATPLPDRLIAGLAATSGPEPSAAYLRAGRRWHDELLSSLRGLPRWPDRLRLIREVLLPTPRYMMASYGLTSRPLALVLAPALYLHRGVHGIWKVVAGRK